MRIGVGTYFIYLFLKGKKILHGVGLASRIAQKRSRMKSAHNKAAVLFDKPTVLFCYLEIRVNKAYCRHSSQTYNDFWVYKLNLCAQPIAAGGNFVIFRVAVLRRAAFYHVRNVYVVLS